jgi:hypothetical protein
MAEAERERTSGKELPKARKVIPATFSLMPSIFDMEMRFGQLYLTVDDIQRIRTLSHRIKIRTAAQECDVREQNGSSM